MNPRPRHRHSDVESAFHTTTGRAGGIPLNVLQICQGTRTWTSNPDVHPNTAGYAAIAQALADVLS